MSATRAALDAAILSELKARVAELRGRSFDMPALLPEAQIDSATMLGSKH
jgi:hypothetical protein